MRGFLNFFRKGGEFPSLKIPLDKNSTCFVLLRAHFPFVEGLCFYFRHKLSFKFLTLFIIITP